MQFPCKFQDFGLRKVFKSAPVANTIWPTLLHQNCFYYFICLSLVHNTKVLVKCEHVSLIFTNTYKPGIFPTTSLQPVNISKNSNLNWAMKLNFSTYFFSPSILFTYSSNSLVYILTNIDKGKLYVFFWSTFLQNSPWNSKTSRKIQQKCV